MNDVRVLAVRSAASGSRFHDSFLSYKSLSAHLHTTIVKGSNFTVLSICINLFNRRSVWIIFWRLG